MSSFGLPVYSSIHSRRITKCPKIGHYGRVVFPKLAEAAGNARGVPNDRNTWCVRRLELIGSMSPWVLPERTLGTVQYTETYPGNYLICRTVPSLLQTVGPTQFSAPAFLIIAIFAKGLRASVYTYRLKFLLGFTVSYSNPTL